MYCVYTEVVAQYDKLLLNKTAPHYQLLPMSKASVTRDRAITESRDWSRISEM